MKELITIRIENEDIKWADSQGKRSEIIRQAIRNMRFKMPETILQPIVRGHQARCQHIFVGCFKNSEIKSEYPYPECEGCPERKV